MGGKNPTPKEKKKPKAEWNKKPKGGQAPAPSPIAGMHSQNKPDYGKKA